MPSQCQEMTCEGPCHQEYQEPKSILTVSVRAISKVYLTVNWTESGILGDPGLSVSVEHCQRDLTEVERATLHVSNMFRGQGPSQSENRISLHSHLSAF